MVKPRADPPRVGFTASGRPSESTTDFRSAVAPSSRNVAWESATPAGVATPAAASKAFATGLSHVRWQDAGREPTYAIPNDANTSRKAPSSPVAPCSTGHTTSGGELLIASTRVWSPWGRGTWTRD